MWILFFNKVYIFWRSNFDSPINITNNDVEMNESSNRTKVCNSELPKIVFKKYGIGIESNNMMVHNISNPYVVL